MSSRITRNASWPTIPSCPRWDGSSGSQRVLGSHRAYDNHNWRRTYKLHNSVKWPTFPFTVSHLIQLPKKVFCRKNSIKQIHFGLTYLWALEDHFVLLQSHDSQRWLCLYYGRYSQRWVYGGHYDTKASSRERAQVDGFPQYEACPGGLESSCRYEVYSACNLWNK